LPALSAIICAQYQQHLNRNTAPGQGKLQQVLFVFGWRGNRQFNFLPLAKEL